MDHLEALDIHIAIADHFLSLGDGFAEEHLSGRLVCFLGIDQPQTVESVGVVGLSEDELLEDWDLIQAGRPAKKIAPLE